MADEDTFWFAAKSHGLGWTLPATWQGWVAVLTYIALLIAGLKMMSIPKFRLIYVIAITVLLVAVVIWKGERPFRWRWGRD